MSAGARKKKKEPKPSGILGDHSLVEVEAAILGELLRNPEACFQTVERVLKPEHFFDGRHRMIYKTILGLGVHPSLFLTKQVAEAHPSLSAYVNADLFCNEAIFSEKQIAPFAQEIRRQNLLGRERRLLTERVTAAASAYEVEEAFGEWRAEALSVSADGRYQGFSEVFMETLKEIEEAKTKGVEMPTPWDSMNRLVGGIYRGDVFTIAARPSIGKTSLGLNIAAFLADRKKKSLIFNLEQPPTQIMKRFIALRQHIEGWRLRSGDLSEQEWKRVSDFASAEWEDYIRIPRVTRPTIDEVITALDQHQPDVFILDFLQRAGIESERRNEGIGQYARRLKDLTLERDIGTILVSQLNRQPELRGKDAIPIMADLKESGDIEEQSDIIGLLYWPHYYNEKKDENDYRVYIAKNRHGATGYCELYFEAKYFAFYEKTDPEAQGARLF